MSGGPPFPIEQLPDELLSRILVAAAGSQNFGSIDPYVGSTLSRVCKRWRALCLSAPELWESVWLTAPGIAGSSNGRSRQQWLEGKLWLLQRVGERMWHLRIHDDCDGQGLMEPLMRAAPCTLRSLQLSMQRGGQLSGLPQLLALARQRFTSLARLDLGATEGGFGPAAQRQPGPAVQQLEAHALGGAVAGVAALAGTLTELKLRMSRVQLPSLAPLTVLRRLRRLEVASGNWSVPLQMPAPAQFPCLEEFQLSGGGYMQVAGMRISAASWVATPAGRVVLLGAAFGNLPALLSALRPPAAGPLQKLSLTRLYAEEGTAVVETAQACAPLLEQVHELYIGESPTLSDALEPLLRQLPRLARLELRNCSLEALPTWPCLSGLQTLSLPSNHLPQLPSALLDATRLQRLDLWGNKFMFPSETELRQLLHALPNLQWLNLDDTGITRASAEALKAAAAARGMTVLLPDFRGRGWSDEGYSSSDSDSSDDGCPRFSWAGCAYASRW